MTGDYGRDPLTGLWPPGDDRPAVSDEGFPRPVCGACQRNHHDRCWGCGCECNRPVDDEADARWARW